MIAYFNRFELNLPDACVAACSHQGSCDEDVAHWEPKVKIEVDPEDIRTELKEWGTWSPSELEDDTANRRRIIWLAACNIKEDERNADNQNYN